MRALEHTLDAPLDAAGWRTIVRAPGRVNLIGDHTDYQDGLCLPLAIDRACVVARRANPGTSLRARSLDADGQVAVAADGTDEPSAVSPPWGRFVAGAARALAERGRAPTGAELMVASTVPSGSGLSSSAALGVALVLALDAGHPDSPLPPLDVARAAQRAEHLATGVPSGLMDQLASVFGREGHALAVDCRTLTVEPVAVPDDLEVLVVHSGVARALDASAYAVRRAECEAGATRLGVGTLRDATAARVVDDPRARHVVSENERVRRAAVALRLDDRVTLGRLLSESHASLRDDFEVSTPELDRLVDLLVDAGAFGARLTGAGFGGCVVAVVAPEDRPGIAAGVCARYERATGLIPSAFAARPSAGATVIDRA